MEIMTEFTPIAALLGGFLIGISAVLLMAVHGRIAGMTGILATLVPPIQADWGWRAAFIAGTIAPGAIWVFAAGGTIPFAVPVSTTAMIAGGLIVGVGVVFGSGCTSGHGVCGIARFSRRSIAATIIFMAASIATVYVIRHVLGA